MTKVKKVILAAGGTGGHFFPAIATSEELVGIGVEVHLITDLRCKRYIPGNIPFKIHILDLHIRTSSIINKIKVPFQLLKSLISAFILVRTIKPDAIVGFGGYPSFPALFMAKAQNVPIIISEQNCLFGKTNRFFVGSAKAIALSYKETKGIDPKFADKIIITGDIVRSSIKNLPQRDNFNSSIFQLFIFGGSQGARVFSKLIPEAIEVLKSMNPPIEIEIVQQANINEQKSLSERYTGLGIKHKVSDFFYNIDQIYQNCDLVIARAGASTIAELSTIGLPAIFIPFPHAADDHQYYNAKALEENGASWCYRQEELTPRILADKLYDLATNRFKIQEASRNLITRKSDGSKILADTVLKIIG